MQNRASRGMAKKQVNLVNPTRVSNRHPHPSAFEQNLSIFYNVFFCSFLHHMGLTTTVMVRSILLRGFDRQMADKD